MSSLEILSDNSEQLKRGAEVYNANETIFQVFSGGMGLPVMYSYPDVAEQLVRSGYLANRDSVKMRMGTTLAFVDTCFEYLHAGDLKGLEEYIASINAKHAGVNRKTSEEIGKTLIHNTTMEQVLMALIVPVIQGMEKVGVKLTPEEKDDYASCWLYIGKNMGINIAHSLEESVYDFCMRLYEQHKESQDVTTDNYEKLMDAFYQIGRVTYYPPEWLGRSNGITISVQPILRTFVRGMHGKGNFFEDKFAVILGNLGRIAVENNLVRLRKVEREPNKKT